jgi:hypothetical protein
MPFYNRRRKEGAGTGVTLGYSLFHEMAVMKEKRKREEGGGEREVHGVVIWY